MTEPARSRTTGWRRAASLTADAADCARADTYIVTVRRPGRFLIAPMLLIATAIRLDSRGSVLFCERRLVLAGKPIMVFKFRTMQIHDAGEDERDAALTGAQDVRITRIGGFLRRSRIDELRQILNVLKGEMSWIGPRPEALSCRAGMSAKSPFTVIATSCGPGISGWAQLNQGHVAHVDEVHQKLQYDFFYIKYFSP